MARCATDLIGVNRNTAAYYFQRLREIIALQLEQAAFGVFDDDELVEITPKTIRIRKRYLLEHERKRSIKA